MSYIPVMATQMKRSDADDEEEFAAFLETAIRHDDNIVASHFAAGQPVYSIEADTPTGCVVKQFPDGRRELIRLDASGNEILVLQAQ